MANVKLVCTKQLLIGTVHMYSARLCTTKLNSLSRRTWIIGFLATPDKHISTYMTRVKKLMVERTYPRPGYSATPLLQLKNWALCTWYCWMTDPQYRCELSATRLIYEDKAHPWPQWRLSVTLPILGKDSSTHSLSAESHSNDVSTGFIHTLTVRCAGH